MAPGYRPKATSAATLQRTQLADERIPNLSAMASRDRADIVQTATWDSFKLAQLSSDEWQLYKRTNRDSAWLHATGDDRAGGLAFLGDALGGLAIGQRDFWRK
jgi:hypothetical protein